MANLVYPQLSTGAVACYPLQKECITRTIVNISEDDRFFIFNDADAAITKWDLTYQGLSLADAMTLKKHFIQCQGRLKSFIFADPTGNLFQWSGDLTAAVWMKSPQLRLSAGTSDVWNGLTAFTIKNEGAIPARLIQSIALPSHFHTCLSIYVRVSTPARAWLIRNDEGLIDRQQVELRAGWQRIVSSGGLGGASDSINAGLELGPGQLIDVCGLQLEPQLSPSEYRETRQQAGLYRSAHCDMESFGIVAEAPGIYSTQMKIEARS